MIGDIHEPVVHPGYLDFILSLQDKYKTNRVMFIGDVVDFHGVSFHAKNPECPGPRDEHEQALLGVQRWCQRFPKAEVMIGNHDERVHRLAASVGIPAKFLRNYHEVWETPGWRWRYASDIDGVHYTHGTGSSGVRPAMLRAQQSCLSMVIGHVHSTAGVTWAAGPKHRLFGMDVGCGVDRKAMAMAYGKDFTRKPVLAAGVVLDGVPYHEIMPVGPGERYHRARYKEKKR